MELSTLNSLFNYFLTILSHFYSQFSQKNSHEQDFPVEKLNWEWKSFSNFSIESFAVHAP